MKIKQIIIGLLKSEISLEMMNGYFRLMITHIDH